MYDIKDDSCCMLNKPKSIKTPLCSYSFVGFFGSSGSGKTTNLMKT